MSILLCAALSLSLLAGCGTEDAGSEGSGSEGSGEGSGASGEEITLSIGGWGYNDYFVPVLQREFNKKYPGITLEYERMEQADYLNKLKVNLSAGTSWDIMMLEAGSMLNAVESYCEPLDEYAKAEWGDNWKEKFEEAAISTVESEDGHVYGLPDSMGQAGLLMYNKTKLEKYGIEVPQTYEELKDYCDKLRADGDLPLVIGGKDDWILTDMFLVIANDIAPGKIVQADAGEIEWTDPDIVKAFEMWQQMFEDGIFQDGCLGVPQYPGASELFWLNGKGGMLAEGDWTIATFTNEDMAEAANKDEYVMAPMPDMDGDGEVAGPVYTTGVLYAINKDLPDEKKEAAWNYIKWFIGEEGQQVMNGPEIGYASTPAFKDITIERTSDYPNYINCMKDVEETLPLVSGPRNLNNVDAKAALGEVLQELGTGMSPEDAAAKVQAAME